MVGRTFELGGCNTSVLVAFAPQPVGRTFKIMKYVITEQQMNDVYFSYLDFLFEGLYEVSSEEYPDSRFWQKGNEVVLELWKSGVMWVKWGIWNDFSNMFLLENYETREILEKWLEKHLNLEGIIPDWDEGDEVEVNWENI